MSNLERYIELSRIILDEVNVKEFHITNYQTEKGKLEAIVSYNDAWVELNNERIEAPKTLEILLEQAFRHKEKN